LASFKGCGVSLFNSINLNLGVGLRYNTSPLARTSPASKTIWNVSHLLAIRTIRTLVGTLGWQRTEPARNYTSAKLSGSVGLIS